MGSMIPSVKFNNSLIYINSVCLANNKTAGLDRSNFNAPDFSDTSVPNGASKKKWFSKTEMHAQSSPNKKQLEIVVFIT